MNASSVTIGSWSSGACQLVDTDPDGVPDPRGEDTQADEANALLESGRSRALEANVASGIGTAAGVGAGVLWFTGAPDREIPRRVSVVSRVARGVTGVELMGMFPC